MGSFDELKKLSGGAVSTRQGPEVTFTWPRTEVRAGLRKFEGASVRAFVPVLVAKRAKDHLRTLQPDRTELPKIHVRLPQP